MCFLKQAHGVLCQHMKSVHKGIHQKTKAYQAQPDKTIAYAHTQYTFQKYQLTGR